MGGHSTRGRGRAEAEADPSRVVPLAILPIPLISRPARRRNGNPCGGVDILCECLTLLATACGAIRLDAWGRPGRSLWGHAGAEGEYDDRRPGGLDADDPRDV